MDQREKLFKYKKIYDHTGSEELFIKAMKESIIYHQENCDFYSKLLLKNQFNPENIQTMEDLYKIPTIPVNFFKYHEIKSIADEEVAIHATSSGTKGQKSQVFLDKESIDLGTKMIIKSMHYHKLISLWPTNYILLGYQPTKGNVMGNVKVLLGMTRFAPAIHKEFALKTIGEEYKIDYFGLINALKKYNKQKLPVRILGFPAFLYMMLKTMEELQIPPLKLNKKSIILTGGGWKKYGDIAIHKEELHAMVERLLGIPSQNCRDFYSAVEHSVAYPECKNHHMHVPIWSRVIIRDVKTLEPLGYNQAGLLSFMSPLVGSMPLSFVIMNDIAVLRDGKDCGCGIATPYFEILDRAGTRAMKSCALKASELL